MNPDIFVGVCSFIAFVGAFLTGYLISRIRHFDRISRAYWWEYHHGHISFDVLSRLIDQNCRDVPMAKKVPHTRKENCK